MSMRLTKAVMLGLAITAGPMIGSAAWAQNPPAAPAAPTTPPTADQLQTIISTAARTRAAQPGFAALSADAKAAALKVAIQGALARSGADQASMAAALTTAANNNVIPAGLAVSIAADVAPAFATQVASNTNASSPTATASTGAVTTQTTVSVLTSLESAAATGGGDGAAPAAADPIVVAPFDPCAGVVAAYCG